MLGKIVEAIVLFFFGGFTIYCCSDILKNNSYQIKSRIPITGIIFGILVILIGVAIILFN